MQAVVDPSARGVPQGAETAVKNPREKFQIKRQKFWKQQQRAAAGPIAKSEKIKELRQKQRAVAKAKKEKKREKEPVSAPDPLTADNLTTLKAWLSQGFLEFKWVPNVADGWLLVKEAGRGLAMTDKQINAHKRWRADAENLKAKHLVPDLAAWYQIGILEYTPALNVLKGVGFDLFVNFFGDDTTQHWAIEVPLAKELGLFVKGWVTLTEDDKEWEEGELPDPMLAISPFAEDDGADDMPALNPGVVVLETERQQEYDEYMRARMKQRNTWEKDGQLKLEKSPTEQEKGEGTVPELVEGGNPGQEPPIPDDEFPGTMHIKYWANEIFMLVIELTREELMGKNPPRTNIDENGANAALKKKYEEIKSMLVYGPNWVTDPKDMRIVTLRVRIAGFVGELPEVERQKRLETGEALSTFAENFVTKTLHAKVEEKFSTDTNLKDLLFPPDKTPTELKLVDGEAWPGERRFDILSNEIIKVAVAMSQDMAKMQGAAGWGNDAKAVNKPNPIILHNLFINLASLPDSAGEDYRISRLRIRVVAFIGAVEDDMPLEQRQQGLAGGGFDSNTFMYLKERVYEIVQDPDYVFKPSADAMEVEPGSDTVMEQQLFAAMSPANPDKVPEGGRSVAQVQEETAEKARAMQKPLPSDYHPIVEYKKTAMYTAAVNKAESDALLKNWKNAYRLLLPSVKQRYDYFYVHTDYVKDEDPLKEFYTDNQNLVEDKRYMEKGDKYKMNQVFIASGKRTNKDGKGETVYAVPSDHRESFGLFGRHQMEHFYQHMVVEGHVMFSVNPDKAIQFFPNDFCCTNVWWWESKLNFPPSSLRMHLIGQGGFNKAYRLLRSDGYELPDHFLFLPPTRVAYGMSLTQKNIANAFAPTKQNGIIYRVAYSRDGDRFGINSPLRELMLAAYCASKGIGPKIFAAYIVPGQRGEYTPPQVKMNPGDPEELLADPIYRAEVQSKDKDYKAGLKPWAPWFHDKEYQRDLNHELRKWGDSPPASMLDNKKAKAKWEQVHRSNQRGGIVERIEPINAYTPWSNEIVRTMPWDKMVVVMESYTADCSKIGKYLSDHQQQLFVDELFRCFTKMGEAGILHCDMKPLNMVQRTWFDPKIDDGTDDGTEQWNRIEIRAIDFDPYFVKLAPWLPTEVLALINAAEYFAYETCKRSHTDVNKLAIKKLKELVETCNEKYQTGVAAAFRALTPYFRGGLRAGPEKMNPGLHEDGTKNNPRWFTQTSDYESERIYNMYADEWEAARAFNFWVRSYMEGRCDRFRNSNMNAPEKAGMLERLLYWIKYQEPSKAQGYTDPDKPGNFAFNAPMGIWGDGTVLGHMGRVEDEFHE